MDIFLLLASAIVGALGIFCFMIGSGILPHAAALGMVSMAIAVGISVFNYQLTIGDEYIEEKEFKRKRIDFRDITDVLIDDQEVVVQSKNRKIRFPKDRYGFRGAIGQVLKAQDEFHFEVYGSPLPFKTALYLARYLQESDELDHSESISLDLDAVRLSAHLAEKGRVYRHIEVDAGDKKFNVEYAGMGDGYECVLVNGDVVAFKNTIFWYQPEFQFRIGTLPAVIKVRVWPWMYLRSISLEIDGRIIYSEPRDRIGSTPAARRAGT